MKTYLFLIGGTGSRVLRSLTMLLASGVKINEDAEIVPVVMDYDATNEDLRRTHELLARYRSLNEKCDYTQYKFAEGGFFKTKVGELKNKAQISFSNDRNTFAKLIGYQSLDKVSHETRVLIDSLYDTSSSESLSRELNLELSVGFKGNPNIGSVVINDYFKSEQFKEVLGNFNEGDRIFIVGSIFGGTGSSGLPQLVRKIRESEEENIDKTAPTAKKEMRNCKVGACVVLPYFGLKRDDNSAINSNSFKSKAKAALSYYSSAGVNEKMDEVYYIGCDKIGTYENCEGGKGQKNAAHLVELLSAMSIVEFINRGTVRVPGKTKYYTYTVQNGLVEENTKLPELSFQELIARPTNDSQVYLNYMKHLNEFAFFSKFFLSNTRKQAEKRGLFSSKEEYYKRLESCLKPGEDLSERLNDFISQEFIPWTEELRTNVQLQFQAFDFTKDINDIIKLDASNNKKVKGVEDAMVRAIAEFLGPEKFDRSETEKQSRYFMRAAYKAGEAAVNKYNTEG